MHLRIKWKANKYHAGTVSKSNRKVERCKIDTHNTQRNDHPLSWFGTDTSIKSGGIIN
jgi:hypothetical protein